MDSFKNIDFKKISIPKAIGLGVLGLLLLFIVVTLVGSAFRSAFSINNYDRVAGSPPAYPQGEYVGDASYVLEEKLSVRNAGGLYPPEYNGSVGNTAEDFEITEYTTSIKTGNLDTICTTIEDLKSESYVIFERANRYDRGCNYTFKVENKQADSVVAILKDLKPETFNENTNTIKSRVDDYTSEVEILEKKLASVEETLTDAQRAYDQVEILATQTKDVESLAKIIDSKIGLIERLTSERINIKERIDYINREKANQLDRLLYTFFNVNVYESHLVDLEQLKDSWVYEFKRMVQDLNNVLQNLTVKLVGYAGTLIFIAVYILLAILVLKYGWRGVKKLWKM